MYEKINVNAIYLKWYQTIIGTQYGLLKRNLTMLKIGKGHQTK